MLDEPTDPRERLLRERTRVCDRMRSLPVSGRLADAAVAGRVAAQSLADLTARLSGVPARHLPHESDTAVADQVAVTAYDVLRVAAPWERAALEEAAGILVDLRRSLP